VIANHGRELMTRARTHGAQLRFEGSVAGGVPVLRAIADGLSADRLVRVAGVVNGTSTHILSRMQEGRAFADALSEAQSLGFAEADPSDDLTGRDAAAKLAILSAIALNRPIAPADVTCRSIASIEPIDFLYAGELKCTIRQVAWADATPAAGCVAAAVRPALVAYRSPLARVSSNQNVVTVQGEFGGETAFYGRGAGGDATAVAVVSDLLALTHRVHAASEEWQPGQIVAPPARPYYLRFVVKDRPGILATIAAALARQRVNLDAVLQEPGYPKEALPFVITVEACEEQALRAALDEIGKADWHAEPPLALPMLL